MKIVYNAFKKTQNENKIYCLKKIGSGGFSNVWKVSFSEKSLNYIDLNKLNLDIEKSEIDTNKMFAMKIVNSKSLRKDDLYLLENEKNKLREPRNIENPEN